MRYFFGFALFFIFLGSSCTTSLYNEVSYRHVEPFTVNAENKMAIASFIYEDPAIASYCGDVFAKNMNPELLPYIMNYTETDSILAANQQYSLPANERLEPYLLASIEKHLAVRYLLVGKIKNWSGVSRERDGSVSQLFEVYDLKNRQLIWSSEGEVKSFSPDADTGVVFMSDLEEVYDKLIYKTYKKLHKRSNIKRIAFLRKNVKP